MFNAIKTLPLSRLIVYAVLVFTSCFAQAVNTPQTATAPAPINWLQHDLRLNGIGVGVETTQKLLFVSLGNGFDIFSNFDATITLKQPDTGYTFSINNKPITNGGKFRFSNVRYGVKIPINRYLNGVLVDTYKLLFTNLPVIQLTAAKIVDEPKSPGTFRLMSGKYKQDTGTQKMGIEFRGSGTQKYPKKSLGMQIGLATDWTKSKEIKLLDLNTDSDWILDSVYVDTTFFRNLVSHDIFRAIHPYVYTDKQGIRRGQPSLRGHLTEVIQNGSYAGVFSLNEKPGRKMYALQKINVPVDSKGLGQWAKVDFNNPENGSVLYKSTIFSYVFYDSYSVKTNFEQTFPKPIDVARWGALTTLAKYIATATDSEFTTGIGKRIDLDSVVDWYALILASHAEDNLRHNFNLAKSGSSKFSLLPWDNDGSFGVNWFDFEPVSNNLIFRLTKLPATGFNKKFKDRWKILRTTELSQTKMVNRFKAYRKESDIGGARDRNLARWPQAPQDFKMGTPQYIDSFLKTWLPQADKYVNALP